MNKKKEIIRGHLNCTCDEAYKSRNMVDPTCFLCEYESEIELMMQEYKEHHLKNCNLQNININMKNEIEKQIFEKMKAKDFGESMCNETKRNVLIWVMQQLRQPAVSLNFSVGDKVIWDNHFGYDIGYFIGEGAAYEHWEIELASGKFCGTKKMVNKSELHHYSKDLISKMTARYGYEKDWSELF